MGFDVYNAGSYDTNDKSGERKTSKSPTITEVLGVKHGVQRNTTPFKRFDISRLKLKPNDVVALVDGDWLAFSTTSMEMKRYLEVEIEGELKEFSGYKKIKAYLKEIGKEELYDTLTITKKQFNHDQALIYAKSSAKKKLKYIIERTGATKLVIFNGSTGNFRFDIPLPKLTSEAIDDWRYKGQRGSEWIPETLPEMKDWQQDNWLSHWSVGIESDDDLVVTKNELYNAGYKVYLCFVDKDFRNETTGGCFDVGQDELWYNYGTDADQLGHFAVEKTKSGKSERYTGSGHKFFAYQMLFSDDADNVHPKLFLKQIGSMGNYGDLSLIADLDKCHTLKELWQFVHDHYKKYLPEKTTYVDCYDVEHKDCNVMYFLNMYYKAYKMLEYEGYEADIRLLFDQLGVKY